jgi:hypothetical protein
MVYGRQEVRLPLRWDGELDGDQDGRLARPGENSSQRSTGQVHNRAVDGTETIASDRPDRRHVAYTCSRTLR